MKVQVYCNLDNEFFSPDGAYVKFLMRINPTAIQARANRTIYDMLMAGF